MPDSPNRNVMRPGETSKSFMSTSVRSLVAIRTSKAEGMVAFYDIPAWLSNAHRRGWKSELSPCNQTSDVPGRDRRE